MISALINTDIEGEPISDEDLQDVLMLILHGGLDTTGSAIANAMLYMHGHHELRDRLCHDPGLLPLAVEEFLRYEAPQPGLARVATADTTIGDQKIRKGDRILLLWASANRDGDVFPGPAEVVPDRQPNHHLTFGIGLHRCIGAPIASAVMRIALAAVLERLPDYVIDIDAIRPADTVGVVFGHFAIPMTFTPGVSQRDEAGPETA